jgi:hypothetical protein
MEQLFTRNPILRSFSYKSVNEFRTNLINIASIFNIATGFISGDSLVELKRMVSFRHGDLFVNLFVGMNYLEGFTQLQYSTLKDLDSFLRDNNWGRVFVSPNAYFHGKLYSFTDSSNNCLGGFVGSSNLSSFLSTNQSYIESDVFFEGGEAELVNENIIHVINDLGVRFNEVDPITQFLPPETDLLRGNERVTKLTDEEFNTAISTLTNITVEIPLKTETKSNLNTYFGAGKTPGRYSPRSWYEVEIIVPKNTPHVEHLPDKHFGPFKVITPNHYMFYCERQGDYSKNLRSSGDLRVLGKWIKGEMENAGVIQCGEMVTQETLNRFGKSKIVFTKSSSDFWYISLQ